MSSIVNKNRFKLLIMGKTWSKKDAWKETVYLKMGRKKFEKVTKSDNVRTRRPLTDLKILITMFPGPSKIHDNVQ